MKRGTTPTHEFVLPFSVDMIDEVEITYCQNGEEIMKKYAEQCTMEGKTISLQLSQDETFDFNEGHNVEIQLRVLTKGGDVYASDIFKVSCKRCLSDEVL